MFEFNEGDINGTTNRLLYNIWQELKRQSEVKPEPTRLVAKATKEKAVKKKFYRKCKKCEDEFDNYGLFMRHMKEHKKKEE